MKLNSAWNKNNAREIKHTWERYIAIMAIIILGVGFYSGLKITKPAMVNNLDNYIDEHKMYDYRLISTLGLYEEDVECFNEQESITAEGMITMDFIASIDSDKEQDNKQVVLKAYSITDNINKLNIVNGRMPEVEDEVVLDASYFTEDIIGAKVKIASLNDDDTKEAFKYDEYTVVGIVDSVSYINYDRGTTSLDNGSIFAFIYLPEDGFTVDYYSEIMLHMDSESKLYSQEYDDMISENEEVIKRLLEERASIRYQDIVDEANEELAKAEKEYDEGYKEYLSEKANAEAELDDAWLKLEDARQEILNNEEKLRDGEIELAKAEEELREGLKDYEDGLKEYEDEKAKTYDLLKANQEELDKNRQTVVLAMSQIEDSGVITQYQQLRESIPVLENALSTMTDVSSEEYLEIRIQLEQAKGAISEIEATGVISQYATLRESLVEIDLGQEELKKGKMVADAEFAEAETKLKEAKGKLDSGFEAIEKKKQEIQDGWQALEDGRKEYEKGLEEYKDGRKEADEGFAEAEKELAEGREKIDEARNEIQDIPEPKVFVLNRNHNLGYVNFDNDSSIVEGVAEVLPIFFFLVAALVCSTTMTRMVDEQRTQIGTLKALGYSNGAIARKYIFYSASAAIMGCIIGFLLGTKFFPMAIWKAYSMLYDFSPIEYIFDAKLVLISFIVSILCSAGVTYISCKSELLQMPASLIRPKAPKAGKRVLLERLPIIWRRVSFLHKVSIRNILRYKRRFFMTITGIAGCTALIVAALGIRDSIKNVANDQFDSIMIYDFVVTFSEDQSEEDIKNFKASYGEELTESVFVSYNEVELEFNGHLNKTAVVATDDPDITKVVGLHFNGEEVPYPAYGSAVLNYRLADEMGLDVGDRVNIRINSTETADVEVAGIFDNYINNYMFITGRTYEDLYGEEPLYKDAYVITDKEDKYAVSALISKEDSVTTISIVNDIRVMVNNMMKSLDSIIWLVIACAGALGFVVIYNLNNINITERAREIATLKVLGFYQDETGAYVFRETFSLTLIGGILGLVMGKFLHMFIMNQIKVEMVSFKQQIFGVSYLISLLATFIVTFLVNWILRKKIDKINMAESLKSVE